MGKWKVLVALAVVGLTAMPAAADDDLERVRKVLREHPEIVVEAIRQQGPAVLEVIETTARARQKDLERARFSQALAKPLAPAVEAGRVALGPQNAPVTIVEYSDFLCHFCGQASGTVKSVMEKRPDDVRLVFKHFATGKNSVRAALYFEAIAQQDAKKAWNFMDKVFARQKDVAEKGDEVLDAIAKEVGADAKKLAEDVKSKALADRVAADTKEARDFGFEGTPVFLINGAPVRGAVPYEVFDEFVGVAAKTPAAAKNQ